MHPAPALPAPATPPQAHEPARFRLLTLGRLVLLRPEGTSEASLPAASRRLALLAYLALSRRPLARDHLAEVFWGEADDARARHSLRVALSELRRVFGERAIPLRADSVALSGAAPLEVDVLELASAAHGGAHDRVVQLYAGPFLDGIHIPDSARFEDWRERERAAAERLLTDSCAAECARTAAAEWSRTFAAAELWLAHAPLDPAPALALLRAALAADTSAALSRGLAVHERLCARLARDYEAAPDAAVHGLAEKVRSRLAQVRTAPAAVAEMPSPAQATSAQPPSTRPVVIPSSWVASPALEPVGPARHRPGRRRKIAAVAAVAAVFAILLAASAGRRGLHARSGDDGPARLAITAIANVSDDTADDWLESGVAQMLAMALAREPAVEVTDPSRVRDIVVETRRPLARRGWTTADAITVARLAGARWAVSGGLSHGGGTYVLDLGLRDVSDGRTREHFTVAGPSPVSVVDQAAARLAAAVDAPATGPRLEDVETSSIEAYHAYTDGLRLRAEGHIPEATRAFDAAVAADSGFVSAVVERLWTHGDDSTALRLRALYVRLRPRARDFDRLMLDAFEASNAGEQARAEELGRALVARYPRDPRAYAQLVNILTAHGRFPEALRVARQGLALDSAAPGGARGCAACGWDGVLVDLHLLMGNDAAAEELARRAAEARPDEPASWWRLAQALTTRGRYAAAVAAIERAMALAPNDPVVAMEVGRRQIEARAYDAADSTIRRLRLGGERYGAAVADLEATLLRERGRFADAALTFRRAFVQQATESWLLLMEAHTRAELGDVVAASRTLEGLPEAHRALAADGGSGYPSQAARAFAWSHALLADGLYLAGSRDTLRLAALADSVRIIGARSGYARDWRLHHHVRGLMAMRGRRWVEAEREFAAARYGSDAGWPRTLVELADAQLHQGRAAAAVGTLRQAYQGALNGMGRYVPRSQLDARMALAFAAAGRPDSAAVYAAHARRAWAATPPNPYTRRWLAALARIGPPATRPGPGASPAAVAR